MDGELPPVDVGGLSDGRLIKMEVDYSSNVDKAIPEAEAVAENGNLQQAIDMLFALEKQTRLGGDMRSNARVQVAIVSLCFKHNDLTALNENIITMSKKRSLIKHAVTKMIQQACEYVDKMPDKPTRLKLIDTLRTVTAGKIYVEVERARLTDKLAKIKEADGNLDEAATILLDLQIETFGSMDRREKVEFLLEQMRICLARKDFTRAQIISRKISVKFFEDTSNEIQQLKLKYYRQMIDLDLNDSNYIAVSRHFLGIYNTPLVKEDAEKWKEALKNAVLFAILAPHDNERSDMLARVRQDKNLEQLALYRDLMQMLSVDEFINWQRAIVSRYEASLCKGTTDNPATGVFDATEVGRKRWEDFRTRIVEHNIRMAAKYYRRMKLQRLSELLDWPIKNTEEFLCQMVVSGTIAGAKIDRPLGIVNFVPRKSPVEALDEWSSSVTKLTELLNRCSHLILKEEMVHRNLIGGTKGQSTATTS